MKFLLLDAGIPTIFLEWPFMLIALAGVVAIEYWYIRKKLPVRWTSVLLANAVTTLLGIPLSNLYGAFLPVFYTNSDMNAKNVLPPFSSIVVPIILNRGWQ